MGKSFREQVETKIYFSVWIKGEESTLTKGYSITVIMLHYILALLHNALCFGEKLLLYRRELKNSALFIFPSHKRIVFIYILETLFVAWMAHWEVWTLAGTPDYVSALTVLTPPPPSNDWCTVW